MYDNATADSSGKSKRKTMEASNPNENEIEENTRTSSSKEDFDLLLAKDNEEANTKDFHMRSIEHTKEKQSATKTSSRITKILEISQSAASLALLVPDAPSFLSRFTSCIQFLLVTVYLPPLMEAPRFW